MKKFILFIGLVLFQQIADAAFIKVGIGRIVITPDLPFQLTGYAGRDTLATQKVHDLWAKAMVIEESANNRIIIVTTDILGLTPAISEAAAQKLIAKYGITRSQIMFNSSHTHAGPMIWPALSMIGDYDTTAI